MRELDVSTGRERMETDTEAYDKIRAAHRDKWPEFGTVVRVRVMQDGAPNLEVRSLRKGEVVEVEVGSDTWCSTVDPKLGTSFLTLDIGEQIARWKKVFFRDADEAVEDGDAPSNASPFQDDHLPLPMRPDGKRMSRGEARIYAAMKQLHAEQDAERRRAEEARNPKPGPVRHYNAQTTTVKPKPEPSERDYLLRDP